jgi:hypothetical protein
MKFLKNRWENDKILTIIEIIIIVLFSLGITFFILNI